MAKSPHAKEIFNPSVVGRAGKKARRWIRDLISASSSTLRPAALTALPESGKMSKYLN